MFNWSKPTVQLLGRYQPWHPGHRALFVRALEKTGQVVIMLREINDEVEGADPQRMAGHLYGPRPGLCVAHTAVQRTPVRHPLDGAAHGLNGEPPGGDNPRLVHTSEHGPAGDARHRQPGGRNTATQPEWRNQSMHHPCRLPHARRSQWRTYR